MANIFDILKNITQTKTPWEDLTEDEKGAVNKYMIQRYLSMNKDYAEIVNIIQKNTWRLTSEMVYKIYLDVIPVNNVFLKYIKAQSKKSYKPDEVEIISNYFEVSEEESKEYIDMLPKKELKEILEQYN